MANTENNSPSENQRLEALREFWEAEGDRLEDEFTSEGGRRVKGLLARSLREINNILAEFKDDSTESDPTELDTSSALR